MKKLLAKVLKEFASSGFSYLFFKKSVRCLLRFVPRIVGLLIPLGHVLHRLEKKPLTLNFATTNICNARCVFCAYRHLSAPQGVMTAVVFNKALHEFVSLGGGNVDFTPNTGEPLLDPELISRIKHCRSNSCIRSISFVTNGILLPRTNLLELLRSGVSEIIISMGGMDRTDYREMFGVDQFENVFAGVIALSSLNKKLGNSVKLSIALRTDKRIKDLESLPNFQMLSRHIKINYQYNYHTWSGLVVESDLRGFMRFSDSKSLTEPCCKYYGGLTVLWNGDVTVCSCTDISGNSQLVLGNLLAHSLNDLWQGGVLRKIRENFYKGVLPRVCKGCMAQSSSEIFKSFYYLRETYR